ncbi:MAG: phosphotransferase [Sphingomonadales bacterium]|nr:phosphotransferase [Sphingomonadales bacterium]
MLSHCQSVTAHPLPVSIDAIDIHWLRLALQASVPGRRLHDFAVMEIIGGTCTKIRLRLEWEEGEHLPKSVILKGGFEPHSRSLDFLLKTEALGYRDLAALSELNAPDCYFADWDRERAQGIVIMEDLTTRGVCFADPLNPRTPDEVARTLTLLARYHAKTWGCSQTTLAQNLSWVETVPPFSRPAMLAALEPDSWRQFHGLPRGGAIAARFRDREWAVGALAEVAALTEAVPNCIIHGDAHLGNVFFAEDGTPGFYDIVPRRAAPLSEVCYHMTFALDVGDRSNCERHLVQHYLDELRQKGVDGIPSLEEAMRQYRVFLAETFCIALVTDLNFQPETPITAYTCRASAALLDHTLPERRRQFEQLARQTLA